MRTGTTLIVAAIALAAGGFAGYRLALPKPEAVCPPVAVDGQKTARKLLYYRNPMGLPDTSPVPKKDPMGMDYLPVYEGEDETGSGLKISAEKIQKLGVKSARGETARARPQRCAPAAASRSTRAVPTRSPPSSKATSSACYVNTSGQPVGRGQPLFEVYSPELVSAQREYAIAAQGVGKLSEAGGEAQGAMKQLAESSLQRLKNWDISDEQVKALAQSGEAKRTLTFRSPVAGVVTEKKAVQGMRFMPGETLFQIADTSSVWVLADVFEQDIAAVNIGQKAKIRINAYPGEVFEGRIAYVYPTLKAETRTVPVRIELANPKGKLKPAMFADVNIPVAGATAVVTVPNSAVIDSGSRQVVIVQLGDGRFEPRPVKLGQRGGDFVQVLEGVKEGELVVTAANFLIDAESNLKAALGGMQKAEAATPAPVGHKAEGTLNGIDLAAGSVTISHGPVPSLNWPSMKMDFVLANPAQVSGIAPGTGVVIEFVERGQGEWVITSLLRK